MRSRKGFAAAVVFLLALPVTLLYQLVDGARVEVVVHVALALGAGLMSFAVFDFRTARWIAWVGCVSTGALAGIFAVQGASELIQDPRLTRLAYQLLGQRAEGWLVDLFFSWCITVLLMDSRDRTKTLGWVVLSMAVGVEAYANVLAYRGTSLSAEAPALKVLSLLPFVWLLFESRKAPHPELRNAAIAAG